MQDIIEKLYNGELYPAEQLNPLQQDFKEKWQSAQNTASLFESKLCDELKAEFQAVLHEKLAVAVLEQAQTFVDGFKIGARIVVEVFTEDKKNEKSYQM